MFSKIRYIKERTPQQHRGAEKTKKKKKKKKKKKNRGKDLAVE